jgi:hypothetical protein
MSGYMRFLAAAFALAAVALCTCPVHAASDSESELKLTLALDKPVIELGRQASLKLTVKGPSGFSEPAVPDVDGLEIIARGRTQSVQIIDLKVKSSKIYGYAVEPQRAGDFTIGPVHIKRRGKVYESNAVKLKVVASGDTPAETAAVSKDVIVEAAVDNSTPYVGQQVTLIFRFSRKVGAHIRNANYQPPQLDDFWNEEKENKREYRQEIGDEEYFVTEVAIPLFPIKKGKTTIGRIEFHYDEMLPQERSRVEPFRGRGFDSDFFDSFLRTGRVVRRKVFTMPIELDVRPLPLAGRPEGFKGGVGNFSLKSTLSGNEVIEGESVTLTVVLSGEGNIRDVADPNFKMDGVKAYSDTPAINIKSYNNKVVGEKIYKVALVPQGDDEIQIPNISIPYFNPRNGRYEVASSAPLTLRVLPAEEEELMFVSPADVRRERMDAEAGRRDILPIHERYGSIRRGRAGVIWARLRPIVYPLPVLIYALCYATARRREKLRTDVEYRRQRFASKTAGTHIEAAAEAVKRKDWDEVFARCSRSVTEYLADKLNVPVGGLTSSDVNAILSEKRVDKEFAAEIVRFLESCDYGRFASPAESPEAAAKCIKGARNILQRLRREEAIR